MKRILLTYLLLLILPAISIASDLTDFTGVGGDFSNGGDTAGADRTLGNTDNFDLGFITNDTTRIHIQGDGKIGIGTTSPVYQFEIHPTLSNNGVVIFQGSTIAALLIYDGDTDAGRLDLKSGGTTKISLQANTASYLNGGDVGINETNPDAKLEINGTLHVIGKSTFTGGSDPPYVLYDLETRQSTIDRIKKEVPKSKLGGATMFFNSATNMMEIFVATTGKFFDLMGTELAAVTPIIDTYPVKTKHYFTDDGTVITMEVPDKADITSPVQYRIKNNYEMDRWSGKFYSMKKDANDNDIRDVEVTKNNAIEVK